MRVELEDFVAPNQIGWVIYQEGTAEVAVKIVRNPETKEPFASLPTAYKQGLIKQVVRYPDKGDWLRVAKKCLQEFRKEVGDEYYYGASF